MGMILLSASPILAVPADVSSGFEIVSLDEATSVTDDKKGLDTDMAEDNATVKEQVEKKGKPSKKSKIKKK